MHICPWRISRIHGDVPEPGLFPTGISAVKVSVRGRVFDGVRDDEGEPTVFELGRPARFVPAERKYSICTQVDFAPRLFWLGCILHPGFLFLFWVHFISSPFAPSGLPTQRDRSLLPMYLGSDTVA